MNRIEKKFRELKDKKKKAFIAFITAGYPDLDATRRLVLEFSKAGVDMIELGIPFSDPLADGPVIQEASYRSLLKKTDLKKVLRLVRDLRPVTQIPICFMTYYNPVFRFGDERFLKAAKGCGVDGVIIPDLPFEEGKAFSAMAKKQGICPILFVSPTTSRARMKSIAKTAKGFIYYISVAGVTGERGILAKDIKTHVRSLKRITDIPVCVGFGVSTRQQVKEVNSFADGVIVGSAIVKKITESLDGPGLVKKVSDFVSALKS